jgi:collagen type VII alpha
MANALYGRPSSMRLQGSAQDTAPAPHGGGGGIPEAPIDGVLYGRENATWLPVTTGGGIPEAPTDGGLYGRHNAAWSAITLTTGPAGPQGPPGPTGPTGLTGSTGPVGPAGPTGLTGAAGANGATGPAGPVGPTGATGPQGAIGAQGPAGPTGPQGAVGLTGPPGLTGATGPTGPQGLTGPVGPVGPAGPSAVSANTGNQAVLGTDSLIFVPAPPAAASPSNAIPQMDGIGAAGSATTYSRGDHAHPSDTSRLAVGAVAGGDLTGAYPSPTLVATTVSAGSYVYASLTVDSKGRLTSASNGVAPPSASTQPPLMDGAAAIGIATTYARADHVHPSDASRAPLASPVFTGAPAAPTPVAGNSSTALATTAFVSAAVTAAAVPVPSTAIPAMDGIGAAGTAAAYARGDHVHPSDTSLAPLASPAFTGAPQAPTPLVTDSSTTLATTAFVKAQGYLNGNQAIALSGDISGSGTTAITTALATVNANVGTFQGLTINAKGLVTAASDQGYAPLASPALTGAPTAPTQAPGTSNTNIATTAFVAAAVTPAGASGCVQYNNGSVLGGAANFNIDANGNPFVNAGGQYGLGTQAAISGIPASGDWFFGNAGNPTVTGSNNIGAGALALNTLTSGSGNMAVGPFAQYLNSTGIGNTAIGQNALYHNISGSNNIAIGNSALYNATGGSNIGIGGGNGITTGTNNIAIAGLASGAGVTGTYNVSIGYTSLSSATTAAQNIAVGLQSMQNLTTGGSNIAIGTSTLRASVSDSNNIAIGASAGTAINGGNYDTVVGNNSGTAITTGIRNTIIGGSAGAGVVAGGTNILIGYGINVPTGDPSSYISIGDRFKCDSFNNIGIGSGAGPFPATSGGNNICIGTNSGTALQAGTNVVNVGSTAGQYATGASNVHIGAAAGRGVSGTTTGGSNTFIGVSAGQNYTTSTSCTYIGNSAGLASTSGNQNTCIGYQAGFNITIGATNTIVGSGAGAGVVTGSSNILIGQGINVPSDTSNYINIGGLITGQMNTGPIAVSKAVNFTGSIGVNGTTAPAKPTVSGAKGSNAALASLIAALVSYGLITDSTTA